MTRLENIAQQVDKLTDGLGLEIDPGIKKAVIAFNYAGFITSQSCEGHLQIRGTPYPWMEVEGIESIPAMQKLLDEFYSGRQKDPDHLRIACVAPRDYRVQCSDITPHAGLVPTYARSERLLARTRQEMDDFADFLIGRGETC